MASTGDRSPSSGGWAATASTPTIPTGWPTRWATVGPDRPDPSVSACSEQADAGQWPDAHEGAAHHRLLRDGAEDPAVLRVVAVVAHHEQLPGRHGLAGQVL